MAAEGDTSKSFPDQRVGGSYLINVVKQTGKAEIRMQMLLLPLIQTPTLPNIS